MCFLVSCFYISTTYFHTYIYFEVFQDASPAPSRLNDTTLVASTQTALLLAELDITQDQTDPDSSVTVTRRDAGVNTEYINENAMVSRVTVIKCFNIMTYKFLLIDHMKTSFMIIAEFL